MIAPSFNGRVIFTRFHGDKEQKPGSDHQLTIEQAIFSYLEMHRRAEHQPKTVEWHQTALSQLQQYVFAERHLIYVHQITELEMAGWFVFLGQAPTRSGKHRAASTIETYARSVRAFCAWLVKRGHLPCTPVCEESFPRTRTPLPHLIQPETFERFVQKSSPTEANPPKTRMTVRDHAILWILYDTGMSVSEMCALQVGDLDRETGTLTVRGRGGKVRQMLLGSTCLDQLLTYLDLFRFKIRLIQAEKNASDDPLFCSESGRTLTKNGVTSLFVRHRKRTGINDTPINPHLLRHSFALRYLQAGGDPHQLQELFGYEGMGLVKQYLRWHDQLVHNQIQNSCE